MSDSENGEQTPSQDTPETAAATPETPAAPAPEAKKEPQFDGEVLVRLKAPGPNPQGLTWDGECLWVADREDRKIYRVSPEDGTPLFSIAFDGELAGTAWDGSRLWQADRTSRTLSRIDPETGAIDVSLEVDLPNGDVTGLFHLGESIWYGLARLGQVRSVSEENGTFARAFPTRPDICGLVVQDKFLYYTEPHEGLVHKMHLAAGAILMGYRVEGQPTGLAHDGEAFWIADAASGELRRIKF